MAKAMFLQPPMRSSANRAAGVSLALHAVALLAIVVYAYRRPTRIFSTAGTASGTHIELVYLPGSAPVPALTRKKWRSSPTAVAELRPSAIEPIAPPLPPALHLPPRPHLTLSPSDRSLECGYASRRVRRCHDRVGLLWLGRCRDCLHNLFSQPGARSLPAASWRARGCRGRCHHRPHRQGRRSRSS